VNLHAIDLPHSRGYRRVDGVEYPRHRADTVTVTASMAWGVRNLISTLSSTGSDRHSPRATGGALLRVACMPSRWRRLFFAAAPMDLPRRPMMLVVAAPCPGCAVLAAGTTRTDCKLFATAAPVWTLYGCPHKHRILNASVLQDASSCHAAVRAFPARRCRINLVRGPRLPMTSP